MNCESRDVSRIVNSVILKIVCTVLPILIFIAFSGGCRSDEDASKALAHARSIFKEVFEDFKVQNKQIKLELEEGKNTLLTFVKLVV